MDEGAKGGTEWFKVQETASKSKHQGSGLREKWKKDALCFCGSLETLGDYNNQMFQENRQKGLQTKQKHILHPERPSPQLFPLLHPLHRESNLIKPRILGNPRYSHNKRPHQLTLVAVPADLLLDTLDIYQWRANTQYPIIPARWTGVIFNKSIPMIRNRVQLLDTLHAADEHVYVEVTVDRFGLLADQSPLSFPALAYAFKEALIGFERLFALFGQFSIAPQNIAIDPQGHIKVWISSCFQQNTKRELSRGKNSGIQHNQSFMINQFKTIFQGLAQNTLISRQFFKAISSASTFIDCLRGFECFVASKKIFVAKMVQHERKRLYSPPVTPQALQRAQIKQCPDRFFSPRGTTQTIVSNARCIPPDSKFINTAPTRTKFRNTIYTFQTNETLEGLEDLQFDQSRQPKRIENARQPTQTWKGNDTEDFTPSSIDLTQPSIKLKKADSLQRRLQELFVEENWLEDCQAEQLEVKGDRLVLKNLGRRIDDSRYVERLQQEEQ